MDISVEKVNPGDLITAGYVNSIVDALDSLQAQIDALGTTSVPLNKPVIDTVVPSPVPAGTTMTIHGHNFAVPAVLNTVTVDGTPLNDFQSGSTDTVINVGVPGNLPGVPGTKSLVVATAVGGASDPKSVPFAAPVIELIGQAQLTNTSGQLGTLTVGSAFLFQFQIDATALNEPEDFRVETTFLNAQGAAASAWDSGTSYVGTSGTDHHVTVSPLAPVTIGVRVVVPTGATSVEMSVQAVSVHNDPVSSSVPQSIPMTIGEAPPAADPSINLTLGTNLRSTVHPNAAGDGLDIKYGSTAVITIDAVMGHAGDYMLAGDIENPDETVWQILDLPQTPTFGDGEGESIQFRLKLIPTSAPATSVTRFFTLTATRQNDDALLGISNFIRFPIGGF
jgi:hypothetical protein